MKQLIQNLSIEKVKQTQYSGGDVCLSSCGKFLLCIYGSCVNVIEVETGETKLKLESEEEEITCISLSPDNKHLITAHKNLLLKQWNNWNDFSGEDTKTKCSRTWKAIHSAPIVFMCFDVTSTLLATASSDFTTKIWDIHAQYCTHNLKGAQGIVRLCKFHPLIEDIQQCVTGCEDGKLRVYDLSTSKLDACLEGHFSAITCFDFLKNDQKYDRLISGSRDKVLIIWDLINFAKLKTIPIYESIESFILMSHVTSAENNECLITMGNEGLLKIWDLRTYKILYKQNENDSLKVLNKRKAKDTADLELVINQGLYNKQTNTLLLVTTDQLIMFIKIDKDLIEKRLLKEFKEKDKLFTTYKQYIGDHGEILDTQMCNSNENLLALATNSEFLKIYNLNTWDCKLLKGHTDLIICLSVFNDKKDANVSYIASSSKDATVRIWKIEKLNENENEYSSKCVHVCKGHTQDVGAICFSKLNFSFLVSGSIDTTIKLWKITEKEDIDEDEMEKLSFNVAFTVKAHDKDINSISVSPNDKLIASGSSDKTAKLWDVLDGSCLAVLRGHKRGIWSIQFSPVDQVVATSSADATIRLWSLADFSCFKTFEGHNTSVLKVYFLNHGTQLISTASDGLIKIWNISTNECVGTFDEHDDKTWAFCMSKDEKKFVSGGADGKLIVWKDITQETRNEEMEKNETILLQEQDLSNFLKEKKWKKALGLAILLDKPFKCYQIIKEILEKNDEKNNEDSIQKGRLDLEKTLIKLREDQIKSILKYVIEWNTNTKFCNVAQCVFELILKNYPPELLLDSSSDYEFASKLIEQFLPYSERHYNRLNNLCQQVMFIDFAWQNMKLNTTSNN